LRGLVDAFVKEEVYYREAVQLGLDRDDTLIRRRMQQKMEFLTEPGEEALTADEATLQAYLDKNMAAFKVAPQIAFEQVYIKPKSGETDAKSRAAEALEALKSGETPALLGDATLLPTLPLNTWTGPVSSPYGLHLVRVTQRVDGYDPKLAEVRDAVAQKWRTEKRDTFQREAYEKLRSKYQVVLPAAKETPAKAEEAAP
jgi:parvulin-like peptidyl-prolyl isomerase